MDFIPARHFTRVTSPARSIDLVVLHTMEYPERPDGAEWCARYFAGPGAPKASAHYCVDNNSVVQGVLDKDVAWAAPGANHNGLQIEHAGYAKQGTGEWGDAYSQAMLALSARLTAKLCKRWNIPVRFVDVAGLKRGLRGITTHAAVSDAFKRSTHWDPGPNFPINDYLAAVKAALEPEEDEMKPWVAPAFDWYLNVRKPGEKMPSEINGIAIPAPPFPKWFWNMVDSADRFRAAKPDGSADVQALRAKIEAAKQALS